MSLHNSVRSSSMLEVFTPWRYFILCFRVFQGPFKLINSFRPACLKSVCALLCVYACVRMCVCMYLCANRRSI